MSFPIFRVSLVLESDQERKAEVELYSLAADGLFLRIDGETVGKVGIIETDPKFVSKRYLAGWPQMVEQFRFALRHDTGPKATETGIEGTRWELSDDDRRFAAATKPEINIFPDANLKEHQVILKTIFAEKHGGLRYHDLSSLLYPLPITPYLPPNESIQYFYDAVTGTRMVAAEFAVVSRIPTEYIIAYIRGTSLTVRVEVKEDNASS